VDYELRPKDATSGCFFKDGPAKIIKNGQERPGIVINENTITFDLGRVYPDDMLAFVRDLIREKSKKYQPRNVNEVEGAKHSAKGLEHLDQAIIEFDKRAVAIHGYDQCSKEERELVLPYKN
jgi:hypothetical protein